MRHLRSVAQGAAAGTKLPSTRALADQFGAGPVTVQRALAVLVADGVVETRPGLGTFVRARSNGRAVAEVAWQTAALGPERAGPSPVGSTLRHVAVDTIGMHGGYPDDELAPTREVAAALARAARNPAAHQRPPVAGLPELRRWFADELGADGWREHDVMIASGGQAALAASFRALAAPGEAIVMESPTYWGAIGAARQAGLVIVPVPRTDGAPSAADLEIAFASSGARVFYAQPNFANPTGDQWNAEQRRQVLDVVVDRGAFLIEDDWAHDFGIDTVARPLATADVDGHVIYIRSLTKTLSLTLRVAAVMARGPARRRIEGALALSDLYVAPVLQSAAADLISRSAWRTRCNRLSALLGERRDALLGELRGESALQEPGFEVRTPPGGLHLWVRLPDTAADGSPTDAEAVAARALTRGLAVSAGAEWFPAEPTGPYVRLSYASTPSARYREAVQTLATSC